ncbi:MAG: SDR family oxidoreductase [Armatimonadetes bacterium]|nr:SDR family oxidoreductase [Armatimonadota bacterium]
MPELNGICAVVTGAGKGIGRATALALAAEGANVFSVARTEADLIALRDEAAGLRGKITPFVADVTDEEKIHLLFEAIRKWIERFDLLVNAAGTGSFGPSEEYPLEEWRRTLETNLTGAFICSREATRLMKLYGGGTILNVASIAGKRGFPQSAAYCASKWGLLGMSHSMAEEMRGTGIKITALCPGATDTPFWQSMPFSPEPSRMMKPEAVAEVIVGIAKQPPSVVTDEMVILPPEGVL